MSFSISSATLATAMRMGHRSVGLRFLDASEPAPGPYAGQGRRVVEAVTGSGDLVGRYASQSEAAAAHGVTQAAVSLALRTGSRCRDLYWRYAEPGGTGAEPDPAHTE